MSSPLNAALLGAIALLLLVLAVFQGINTFHPRSVAPTGVQDVRVQQRQLKPETVRKEEVLAKGHHKRLLWTVPIPGTKSSSTGSSSSK